MTTLPLNWDHVTDQITRDVLDGKLTDEDSLEHALEFADQCLQADRQNEDVSLDSYYIRAVALDEAEVSCRLHGDVPETVKELKKFWAN